MTITLFRTVCHYSDGRKFEGHWTTDSDMVARSVAYGGKHEDRCWTVESVNVVIST